MSETKHIRVYQKDWRDLMEEVNRRRLQGEDIDVADVVAQRLEKARGGSHMEAIA